MKIEKFYTADELAEALQLNIMTIYRYIKAGKLKAYKFGNTWAVSESECKRYKAEKRAMGRPKNNFE